MESPASVGTPTEVRPSPFVDIPAPSPLAQLNMKEKPLLGWILVSDSDPQTFSYEMKHFFETAPKFNIQLRAVAAGELEVLIHREDRKSILLNGKATRVPDFLLPRLGAGTTYFALALMRQLERVGVFVINGSEGVEMAKDKLATSQTLSSRGIPVPATMLMKFPFTSKATRLVEEKLGGFPCVLKLLSGSQGNGVFLCDTPQRFEDLMELLEATSAKSTVIVQQFIKSSRGRDLRVFCLGGRVLALMERRAAEGQFKANIHQGGKGLGYELDAKLEWLSLDTARLVGLDLAGVDVLFDTADDGSVTYKICEVNSSPGFEGLENANPGLDVANAVFTWVQYRLAGLKAQRR